MTVFDQYKQILARCLDICDFQGLAEFIANHEKCDLFLCWKHKTIHTVETDCGMFHQIATNQETLESKLPEVQTWANVWLPRLEDISA